MPKPTVATEKPKLSFNGKTVVLAGKFTWRQDGHVREIVLGEGGVIANEVCDDAIVIVGSESRGTPAVVKEAEKLVKKGANIEFIDQADLFSRLVPNKDEMARILKAGDAERFRHITDLDINWGWGTKYDLSNSDFSDQTFKDFPFEFITLDDCTFNNSSFRGGSLKVSRGKFHRSKFDLTNLSEMKQCQFQEAELMCLYITSSMQDCDLSDATFNGVSARSCKIKNTKFKKATLTNTLFDDSSFDSCDFSLSNWQGCGANGVTFKNCNFNKALMKDIWLVNCKFVDCDFTDCDLTNANLALSTFTNTKVDRADFSGAILAGASTKDLLTNAGKARGLKEAIEDASKKGNVAKMPEVDELSKASVGSSGYDFEAVVEIPDAKISCRVTMPAYYNSTKVAIAFTDVDPKHDDIDLLEGEYLEEREAWVSTTLVKNLPDAMHHISCVFDGYSLCVESVNAKITKGKVKSKEFRNLALRAWCAAFGVAPPSDKEIKKLDSDKKENSTKERDQCLTLLRGGPDGIKSFNEMMTDRKSKLSLKKIDLSGCNLTKVNFAGVELQGANLANCVMKQCTLQLATLSNANLKGVTLDGANCHLLLAEKADFSGASMGGADMSGANLLNSCLHDARCKGVNFSDAALQGADFTNADLTDVHFEQTQYNEKTVLPVEYLGSTGLLWYGYGTDPGKLREVMQDVPSEPIDFAKFLERLEISIDKERLKKAIKMLQAESFQLFAEVKPEHMIGVVKSQTDPDLVYSCQLTKEGKFCCGTQNLNACGGLRGALCKHLLVLLLGLTRAGELDATIADTWARASKLQNPKMEKEIMSETFLRYKGAEAGELDWRPTETIPEDYYAF